MRAGGGAFNKHGGLNIPLVGLYLLSLTSGRMLLCLGSVLQGCCSNIQKGNWIYTSVSALVGMFCAEIPSTKSRG